MSMDPFFFRNRLSAWVDGELPKAESRELETAMGLQPELQAEADAYRAKIEEFRAIRLTAPMEVMPAAMSTPAPGGSWRLPLAFALLLLVGMGIWWTNRSVDGGQGEAGAASDVGTAAGKGDGGTTDAAVAGRTGDGGTGDVANSTGDGGSPDGGPPAATGDGGTATVAKAASRSVVPRSSNPYVPKGIKGHSRLTVVIPKDIVEDPDATDFVEEVPLPHPVAVQPFRYRLTPNDPNTVLRSLKDLVLRVNGQFLNPAGGTKATYPIESGSVDRVLLKVAAANLPALIQNLSTTGTVSVVAQPEQIPPSGMVGVFVEVDVPPQ